MKYVYELTFYDSHGNWCAHSQTANMRDIVDSARNWLSHAPNNSITIKTKLKKGV